EHTAPHRPWSRKAPLERSRDRALRTPSGFAYHQPRLAGSPTIGRGSRTRTRRRTDAGMSDGARSFADIGYDEAMRRARALVPVLRERADRAEALREMQKETVDDLHRTGLLRFHQPRRWGGMELEFVSLFDIPAEIGRGCASTAWNVANLGVHHWMLSLYDERAQEELWGKNPDALIASGIAYPQGRGRRVDGGFVISGFWNFSSGVDAADWNMLAATDRGGSEFPGARVNPNPLYRVPLSALGSHCLAAAGVGNAQAALELTLEAIQERSTSYTAMRMRDFQAVQLRVAGAGAKVDAARLVIRTDCLAAQRIAGENRAPTVEEKLRFKRNVAYAMELCTETVDALHALAGANA